VLLRTLLFGFTSQSSRLASVVWTLAVLALIQPLPRRTQEVIDRRFYRRKYDAAKTFKVLSAKLRHRTDLDALNVALMIRNTIQLTPLQLKHTSLGSRTPKSKR
jgi:hypothetical protein